MNDDRHFRVIGIAGSLRRVSLNEALLTAAIEVAPPQLTIDCHDLADIPLYNQDLEDVGAPPAVTALRDAVRQADAILIATPEYNHGVPGVMKNTIDWLSRPAARSALNGKAAALMGASPGLSGTARCQTQLRQAFVFTDTYAMCQPEILVRGARDKFDAAGRLTDEPTRRSLTLFLNHFVTWIGRFVAPPSTV
jgi:chromate reductase